MLILTGCAAPDPRQQFAEKADAYFRQLIAPEEPGGAVLIMKDTTVIFSGAYGLADLGEKTPMTTSTLLNLGSISKTFVSNAILILQQEGRLSVNDSLIKYFPDFKNKEIAKKVRIRHLLTHTSGLPDNRPVSKDSVFYLTADDQQNWAPVMQNDTLEFEPGTNYNYSNPAFNALALIVEQVSGQKWQDFIADRIFTPAGMGTSTITDGAHPESGVAHGYTRIAGQWREDDYGEEPTFCASGNGGVWSSVEELAKYELAIRKSVFLPAEVIADSRTIKRFDNWKGEKAPFIGWSWFVDKTPDGLTTVGHTGHQGGFAANYIVIPEKQLLLVVTFTAPYDVYEFRDKFFALLKEYSYF